MPPLTLTTSMPCRRAWWAATVLRWPERQTNAIVLAWQLFDAARELVERDQERARYDTGSPLRSLTHVDQHEVAALVRLPGLGGREYRDLAAEQHYVGSRPRPSVHASGT
jgi:hypothetical protein